MTMLLIVTQTAAAEIFGSLSYLITMVAQIAIFCWVGNEIIHAVFGLEFLISNFISAFFCSSRISWRFEHIFQISSRLTRRPLEQ